MGKKPRLVLGRPKPREPSTIEKWWDTSDNLIEWLSSKNLPEFWMVQVWVNLNDKQRDLITQLYEMEEQF